MADNKNSKKEYNYAETERSVIEKTKETDRRFSEFLSSREKTVETDRQ